MPINGLLAPFQALSGRERILLALSAALAFAYLFDDFGLAAPYPLSVALKASGIILLGAIALGRGKTVLALGLFLGSAGDAFLALEPAQIAYGIGAFGLGHIVYVFLFGQILKTEGQRDGAARMGAGLLVLFGVLMLAYLQPHFAAAGLRIPASLYVVIIMAMAILAVIGRAPVLAMAGALLFVVSDSVLSLRMFANQLDWAGPVVWVTYYLGQLGIGIGLAMPAGSEISNDG